MSRRWLSYKDLKERGYPSEVSLWRWVKAKQFPAPTKLAGPDGRNYWASDVIEAYEAERIAAGNGEIAA
jgi:predicted DNA-binding transcriptional regulator AlpA